MREPFTVRALPTWYSAVEPCRVHEPWQACGIDNEVCVHEREHCEQAIDDARALSAAYALGVRHGAKLVDAATPKRLDRDEMDHLAWLIFTPSEYSIWQRTWRKVCPLCGLPARPHDETERR